MTRPYIAPDNFEVDALATPATLTIAAKSLREGMVLVDDLGCPAAVLDHRIRATRGSGEVAFLAHDLDTGRLFDVKIHENRRDVVVMAA